MKSNKKVNNPYKRQCEQLNSVWNDDTTFGIEKCLRIFLCLFQFATIGLLVKFIFGEIGGFKGRKIATELYMLFNLLLPLMGIILRWYNSLTFCIIITILLIETILYLLTLVFLEDIIASTASFKRNFICISCNYIQTVFCFAVFYLHNNLIDNNSRLGGIYYSIVTQSTLGYGDIHPLVCDSINIVCVIFQIIIGLMFVVLFFARGITSLSKKTFMHNQP